MGGGKFGRGRRKRRVIFRGRERGGLEGDLGIGLEHWRGWVQGVVGSRGWMGKAVDG